MLSDISKKIVALPLPLSVHATGSMLIGVGDEIRFHHTIAVELAVACEESFFPFEAVREGIRVIDDEIFAVE